MAKRGYSLKQTLSNIDKFAMDRAPAMVAKQLHEIGKRIKVVAKENVDRSPPDHPQVQTGALQKSVKFRVHKSKYRQVLTVYSRVDYAPYLEYGFIHANSGRRVGPYPWLRPAYDRVLKDKKGKWRL